MTSRAVAMDIGSNYLAFEFVLKCFLKPDISIDPEFYVFGFGQR